MLTWFPFVERFESDRLVFLSNRRSFSFLLIDQQLEISWPVFLQCVQKTLDRLFLDFDRCQSYQCLSRLEFRPVLLTCFLERLNQLIDLVEWWASAESLMVSPIDFHAMSSVRTWPIVSSKFSFKHVLAKVVQNISQLAGKLESSARAFTSSSKFNPWEDSSANTRLKVLIWEVVGMDSFIFILNNCRIHMSSDEDYFFL